MGNVCVSVHVVCSWELKEEDNNYLHSSSYFLQNRKCVFIVFLITVFISFLLQLTTCIINWIKWKDSDKIIRKVERGYHNIYTSRINFARRHHVRRSFSLRGQKFSKQTLSLVRGVNSPSSQQRKQEPLKQSSLFISGVNSSLHKAHHRKVKNLSRVRRPGSPCKHALPLDLRGHQPEHFPGSGLIRKKQV